MKTSSFIDKHYSIIDDHAKNIVFQSSRNADYLRKEYKLDDSSWFHILLEFINLFVFLTDNSLIGKIKDKYRFKIYHIVTEIILIFVVETICKDWPDEMKTDMFDNGVVNAAKAMEEYSQYKYIYPPKDEGPKDTVFWEFEKTVSICILVY